MNSGHSEQEAQALALSKYRNSLRNELADVLAYVLKIANYTGIDLEQAYIEKMEKNIGRNWSLERTLPD
jgi:NTP pyrophosphatase (non-canonical NTP hydrolase)